VEEAVSTDTVAGYVRSKTGRPQITGKFVLGLACVSGREAVRRQTEINFEILIAKVVHTIASDAP
jgi:hypothetical protein